MEIEYNRKTGEYSFYHEGESWEFEKLKNHFRDNGHQREPVCFGVPNEAYGKCREMAKEISSIFDEKESRKRR
jgi:hypothetical protein